MARRILPDPGRRSARKARPRATARPGRTGLREGADRRFTVSSPQVRVLIEIAQRREAQ